MSGPTDDFVYDNAHQLFATAQLNWPAAQVYAMVVSAFYIPLLSHVNVSEIPSNAVIVRDLQCTNKSVTKGICACNIPELEALVSVYPIVAVILYIKGSDDDHSPLVYYSSSGPGFPFLAQGFSYLIAYDQAAGGFFQV